MPQPRFDYEHRIINHFSVNKMTQDNQTFAAINRGSFVENEKNRQDYTGDSENVSPMVPNKLLDRIMSGSNVQVLNNHMLSPTRSILESPLLLQGLETYWENSELYDNFDIYHEMLLGDISSDHMEERGGDDGDSALCGDDNIKSMETQSD